MTFKRKLCAAAVASAAWSAPAHAIDFGGVFGDNVFSDTAGIFSEMLDTLMPGVTNVRLGLGPAWSPRFEGSDNYKVRAAPLISLRYRDLIEIDNNNLRVNILGRGNLLDSANFSAGPLVKVDFGRDESDSIDLRGLGKVGTSLELGVFGAYTAGPARYRLKFRQDVTSGHSGLLIDADVTLAVYRSDTFAVGSRLSTTWASSDYMNSYFGVTAAQAAASGLAVYRAGSGMKDVTLSAGGEYRFSERWALVLNGSVSQLLSDAKNNPLVDTRGSPTQLSLGAFAVFTF
ncbi:MAG: MipA/OmpV family protein [Rhodospirillaceae bacterium]|nr:MipA/OmpV family protein [Rhodospirillaceae bacterium]